LTTPIAGAAAGRVRGGAWLLLAALLGAGAAIGWALPSPWIDWQPGRAPAEPWRALSAAFVHWSPRHLAANLAGLALVAALGWAARLPAAAALAWALAWPAGHALLALEPALRHYGGLSGVLHAGVAVAAAWLLLCPADGRQRAVGAAVAAVLALKIGLERPWGDVLQHPAGWDIAVAPLAHATGAAAGALAGALAARREARRRRKATIRPR
jgi:rhomboid family GlyGly-CTERM serine protease